MQGSNCWCLQAEVRWAWGSTCLCWQVEALARSRCAHLACLCVVLPASEEPTLVRRMSSHQRHPTARLRTFHMASYQKAADQP